MRFLFFHAYYIMKKHKYILNFIMSVTQVQGGTRLEVFYNQPVCVSGREISLCTTDLRKSSRKVLIPLPIANSQVDPTWLLFYYLL